MKRKIKILCNIAKELDVYPLLNKEKPHNYLSDYFTNLDETNEELFDYKYDLITMNLLDKIDKNIQRSEYIKILNIKDFETDIKNEINNIFKKLIVNNVQKVFYLFLLGQKKNTS